MSELIKNVAHSTPFELVNLIEYEKGKVASLTFAQKPGVGITLFAFDEGEGVNTHAAPGDAMAVILDGEAEIIIDGKAFTAKAGEGIVMSAGIPHAVKSITRFKMLLTVVK
ncbi:cupin domain-containing protein [Anaerotignum propionicum]|uniref:Cupin domain protein n=1 Tax=Anaerotignum propionicum DSM 1682 TaxID=991789 RepID=A0A0X1U8U8_ANAPI|nr:cupin domain-containing protein [Anaerotignum propionicum]AMJ41373.1 cupin domain protein [Anaerotignum propionicum DSM 1682]SHE98081.1 Cupin domain-containing protein [[Clostridium] propionicum DSM 1682] [Anaerotignum propionicum DSM 1682]